MQEFYTPEEIELLRKQLREGNRLAKEAAIRRGVKLHPRLEEKRANITSASDNDDPR